MKILSGTNFCMTPPSPNTSWLTEKALKKKKIPL